MSEDPRAELRESWEASAVHWGRTADRMAEISAPVTGWLLDAARLRPGSRVLELGAGPGDLGIRAAERVRPGGEVVLTDVAEGMLAIARERAERADASEVSTREVDAEWIDAPTASFDAVLSRWGLMFTVDPEAPFREIRRVLRPEGRLATAAWAAPDRNPFLAEAADELFEQGLVDRRPGGDDAPGPFRFAAPSRLDDLLHGAGFDEVEVTELAFSARFGSWDDLWWILSEQSTGIRTGLALTDERGARALQDGVRARLERFADGGDAFEVPFVALGAAATA